jgi:hypothetical protein
MSLLFADSFSHYTTTAQMTEKYDTISGTIGTTTGRYVGNALSGTFSAVITKQLDEAKTTIIAGMAVQVTNSTASGTHDFFQILDEEDNEIGTLGLFSSNFARRYFFEMNGVQYRTDALNGRDLDWQYLEIKLELVQGQEWNFEFRMNEETIHSGTIFDEDHTKIGAFRIDTQISVLQTNMDDLYVCDDSGPVNNDFLGDVSVEALFPNAAGTNADWAATGAGTNHEAVDETTPDDDTTYVASSTATDKDLYNFDSMTLTSGTVFGVQLNCYARRDDAGNRVMNLIAESNGTENLGTSNIDVLNPTYSYFNEIYELDPDTAVAWTVSGINAAEFGQQVVS